MTPQVLVFVSTKAAAEELAPVAGGPAVLVYYSPAFVRAEASVDVLAVPFYSDLIVGEQADGCDRDPMKRHWESLSSTPTGGGRRLAVAARCPAGGIPGSHGVRACCEAACGECGGRGCDARPGGRVPTQS